MVDTFLFVLPTFLTGDSSESESFSVIAPKTEGALYRLDEPSSAG